MIRVGLKFCGGCDPAYDRDEYWSEIKDLAEGKIEWVRLDAGGYGRVLMINACETACVAEELSFGPEVRILISTTGQIPAQEVVAQLVGPM